MATDENGSAAPMTPISMGTDLRTTGATVTGTAPPAPPPRLPLAPLRAAAVAAASSLAHPAARRERQRNRLTTRGALMRRMGSGDSSESYMRTLMVRPEPRAYLLQVRPEPLRIGSRKNLEGP